MAPSVVLLVAVTALAVAWMVGVARMFFGPSSENGEGQLQEVPVRAQNPRSSRH